MHSDSAATSLTRLCSVQPAQQAPRYAATQMQDTTQVYGRVIT